LLAKILILYGANGIKKIGYYLGEVTESGKLSSHMKEIFRDIMPKQKNTATEEKV